MLRWPFLSLVPNKAIHMEALESVLTSTLILTEKKKKINKNRITRLGCLVDRWSLALIIGPTRVKWANTPIGKI